MPSLVNPVVAECRVHGIPAESVRDFWLDAEILLRKSVDMSDGRMTMQRLKEKLLRSQFQLWGAFDEHEMIGAWVTRIEQYPQVLVCEVVYLGGHDIQQWLEPGLDLIEGWAKSLGCERLGIAGRPGWKRLLQRYGYGHYATVLEKVL